MEGKLWKKGHMRRNWKERHFVLDSEKLSYFSGHKLRGKIVFKNRNVTIRYTDSLDNVIHEKKGTSMATEWRFEVNAGGTALMLAADSREHMIEWIDAIVAKASTTAYSVRKHCGDKGEGDQDLQMSINKDDYEDDNMLDRSVSGLVDKSRWNEFCHSADACELDDRYRPQRVAGQGSYGMVIAALDKETDDLVAVKYVPDLFRDLVDAKRILREIRLMRFLQHENILSLRDLRPLPAEGNFNAICLVSNLMQCDLHDIISKQKTQMRRPFEMVDVKRHMYQILCGLKFMHSAGVYHRDMKPSNLFVSDRKLKIADLGLGRGADGFEGELTTYVVTRWYRAPEVMLLAESYDGGIDVWAAGCILAELYSLRPIFPGTETADQLHRIFAMLGKPPPSDCEWITHEKAKRFVDQVDPRNKYILREKFANVPDPDYIDLVTKLLVFDPQKRLTAAQALEHPFFSDVRDPSCEIDSTEKFDFGFEKQGELTKVALQALMRQDTAEIEAEMATEVSRTESSS